MKNLDNPAASIRALRDLVLLCASSLAAASIWASGIQEDGIILDGATWRQEVAGAPSPDWPVDAWYRLTLADRKVEVSAVRPSEPDDADPADSLYVRVPGARLIEGARAKYRFSNLILRPKLGHQYELMLGKTRFSFVAESGPAGVDYAIGYGGEMHTYRLGEPDAQTTVEAVADLDGDAMPDFLVQVGEERFLLLSTQAQPGGNTPSAQLWAMGGC